ncbi:hypothetical protein VPH35_135506 [Triticum aestivum]
MEQDGAARPLAPGLGRRRRGRLGSRRHGGLPYGAPAECPEAVDHPPCRRLRGHVSAAASAQPRSCATLNYDSVGRTPATASPIPATTTTASARKSHGLGICTSVWV